MIQQSVDVATERPGRFGPLPDEALDALVTILDETRFGRSRSRSELVTRTGLGRAIVAQRVGELIERGLVTEGDVGPSTGVISDGHVHGRAQGSAGDVGHISVTDDPSVVCRCGNIGCLEALAGGAALGRAAQAAAEEGRSARLQTALDQRGEVTAERRRWSATGSSRGSRWPAGSRRASRPA